MQAGQSYYHLQLCPSVWRRRTELICAIGLVVAVGLCIRLSWFWLWPLLACAGGLLLHISLSSQNSLSMTLNERGSGYMHFNQPVQLLRPCLLTPFACALRYHASTSQRCAWQWVWRDQLNPAGWSRLRRIALNVRR